MRIFDAPSVNSMPSTAITSFHYDPEKCRLRVKFVSGLEYDYKNVPPEIYKELTTAGSKGRYLNLMIKGKYEFERIS